MEARLKFAVALGAALVLQAAVQGADYFVTRQGNDANRGADRATSFLTIQRGVSALKPGDTLTIGPGEYAENVKLHNFGEQGKETLIRAELAGTVVLRGDRDADLDFAQVPGRRFVYAADCKMDVLSVHEVDTLTNLAPAADPAALEFGPARYWHDAEAGKLYLSTSDFQPATCHRYTIGVLRDHGFHMLQCRRVVLDGLAAAGYRTAVEKEGLLLPTSGFMLHQTEQCTVRRCTAFFNGSGITINSGIGGRTDQPGEGKGNLVEDCRAFANRLDGIVAYNPSGETIRNCQSFLNQTYGARFYGGRAGDAVCLMSDVLAWGNPGADFWTKGGGLSEYNEAVLAERCIALRDCNFGNFQHGIIGGRNVYRGDRPHTITLPSEHEEFHQFNDAHFADPMNFDFRLQATSSFRQSGEGKAASGPHPYKADIYYVKPGGNDDLDGLSLAAAWKTPSRAVARLKPGDTLYIAPGRYAGDLAVNASNICIRGRGIEPVVIEGGLRLAECRDVSVERLQFSGPARAMRGGNIELANCVLAGQSVEAKQVEGLRLNHNLLVAPLRLVGCSAVILSGNLHAAAPAVQTDTRQAVRYSSYNSYPGARRCWEVGGKVLSLEELRPGSDAYSVVRAPKLVEAGGAAAVANADQFAGRGPLATAIGPYRRWQPRQMDLVGPFVDSKAKTSADIEWWSSLPVEVDLCWGDTPQCANRKRIAQNAFYSYSLVGLEAGKKYYVKVAPRNISPSADPARRYRLGTAEAAPVEFTPAGGSAPAMTYYVAPDGNDGRDGRSRETAWKSLQHAADRLRPGDTAMLAGGKYPGTFYFRATGEQGRPITLKAIPGEKASIDGMGETLKVGFVLYGKHHYRVDSLYFDGYAGIEDNVAGAEQAALFVRDSADLQVTRCHFSGGWGRCLVASGCPDLLARNCVFMHSMEATMFFHCAGLRVENCVFISPLIHHILVSNAADEPFSVENCIFGENTRHKVHIPFVSIGRSGRNNCFHVRLSEYDRKLFGSDGGGMTLPEYRQSGGESDSLVANPHMPGVLGWRQGWCQIQDNDFDGLFATNPKIVVRGIGLQPEAFRDFHFWKGWPYDRQWAEEIAGRLDAAEALVESGKDAEALAAYTELAGKRPMTDRLKTDVLDRAAECAARLKNYERAMELAKSIPLEPFAIRRQMAILIERKEFAELVKSFSNQAMGGRVPHTSWICPETEHVMADALYYRGIAYAESGDLKAAEADLLTMVVKGDQLGYTPGDSVLAVAWKRLGDFYRTWLKDGAKALDAYRKTLEMKSNPEIRGVMEAAAAEARKLEQSAVPGRDEATRQ